MPLSADPFAFTRHVVTALLFSLLSPFRSASSFSFQTSFHTTYQSLQKRAFVSHPPFMSSSALTPISVADPYSYLEDVSSESNLQFAKESNDKCLLALGDPELSTTYGRVLRVLESTDRIPHVSKYGIDEDGETVLLNFWKDGTNPKGIWRKTTLGEYETGDPTWTALLDLDVLGKSEGRSWVWKGSSPLPRARDPLSPRHVSRALVKLSDGGADAIRIREFNVIEGRFVPASEGGFAVEREAKTRITYRSRDVVSIGSDFGAGSLTSSGYPRTIREWTRGTDLEDSVLVFEGSETDVSVGAYLDDQRTRGGEIYEVRYRSMTFYTSKVWVRRVKFEHLLKEDDPARVGVAGPEDFVELDVPEDASSDFFGNRLFISLRSDWEVGANKFESGSLVYVDYKEFVTGNKEDCNFTVLFSPAERTALEGYTCTKSYIILSVMDNVRSKLVFFHHDSHTGNITAKPSPETETPKIRSTHIGAFDPNEDDRFWFTVSGYTQPTTLLLGDATLLEPTKSNKPPFIASDPFVDRKMKSLPPQYDSQDIVVEQRFATSEDGTSVPYFLICHRSFKDAQKGNTPTLLYGYGGFEISMTPHYTATQGISWLERGGAYVEANIRGGGEFGPSWHQAALKEHRHKSFEDFIAVAQDLIATGVCRPNTLGIRGGSNGGLLVGNMYTMRPDLFGAIHCAVPLLDMKKYHKLLAGASWMAEYGDPDTEDWERFLNKYSPYHNLKEGVEYPPMLVTTSTRDDRVHPAHARKMVKKLWDMGVTNTYYYENIEGGHGGAADSKQSAFMTALAYNFLWDTLQKGIEN